ncbi:MAG: Holliday junction branch migration protein RuvA [Nitrospinae bacterium]|nr:Holliday junction branch migration protein RuvA [Nitrospinota bacterium]
MIAYLKGKIIRKKHPSIILDVNGVGYEVSMSMYSFSRLPSLNEIVELEIYTQVMEDAINLYGFTSDKEKELFHKLIGISKIGCKKAIGILSGATYTEIYQILYEGDADKLKRLPGVGLKTAQRIIVELRGKLELPAELVQSGVAEAFTPVEADVKSGLLNLGYGERDVQKVLTALKGDIENHASIEELIKKGLKLLIKR